MSRRISDTVARGAAVSIQIDGKTVEAFEGETVATAMLAADRLRFRTDTRNAPRGMFCNMGTCGECTVTRVEGDNVVRRIRACLTPVDDGMILSTGGRR